MEGAHAFVDLAAQAGDMALADTLNPHGFDQIVDGARRIALDKGFLDDGRQRLLDHSARLQEGREKAAAAQFGDAQLDSAGPRLPVPIVIAVALVAALGRTFARGCGAERLRLQRYQPLGGKADHRAQKTRVGGLLQKRGKRNLVIGNLGGSLGLR